MNKASGKKFNTLQMGQAYDAAGMALPTLYGDVERRRSIAVVPEWLSQECRVTAKGLVAGQSREKEYRRG